MTGIVFTPDRNTGRKKDYVGTFRPEALAFAAVHGLTAADVHAIDVSAPYPARAKQVLALLSAAPGPLDHVAFFCHGLPKTIQLGFGPLNVARLGKAIAKIGAPDVKVALYACSTASGKAPTGEGPGGDGGFADRLRDAICEGGAIFCRVDGHTTAGHATYNPRIRRFEGDGSPIGGNGGRWIVPPKSQWWKAWVEALRGEMRLQFPMMTVDEVRAKLA